ncbi:MAG: DUF4342 domain-containing protein [Bacillota bacterium]
MTELEKIDVIRERLGVSYKEAREALAEKDGDVVEALIWLEEKQHSGWTGRLQERGEEIMAQVKTVMEKGNHTKIKVKQGEKTLFEIPATLGALGVIGALASTPLAVAAGIGTVAAMANQVTLEFDKKDQGEENQTGDRDGGPRAEH